MNVKGREKEDGAFKFYEQESARKATIHKAWPIITHDARRTTHDPRPTTYDPRATHLRQLVNLLFFPSTWQCAYGQEKHIQTLRFTN